jgi:hypothetical protein
MDDSREYLGQQRGMMNKIDASQSGNLNVGTPVSGAQV